MESFRLVNYIYIIFIEHLKCINLLKQLIKLEKQLKLVHKIKYKDMQMQMFMHLQEVHYLQHFLINMINKLLNLLHIILMQKVYII